MMTLKTVTLKGMVVLTVGLLAAQVGAQEPPVLKTQKEKTSYAIGVDMAKNLRRQGVDLDLDVLIKGFQDEFMGGKLLMSDDDLRKTMAAFPAEVRRKRNEARQKQVRIAEDNKKEGEAFLAENKTKEGVVTLPSGLQYKILKAGDGKKPTEADTVEFRYRGTLINGTEFDSSPIDGQPETFKVGEVIPGWREALKLMPVGSKWQIFIPPHLGYGARPSGRDIGPNATLIFEMDLIATK
jgi:FKBP-type peptidyl-prolyl cis-trans isomerase